MVSYRFVLNSIHPYLWLLNFVTLTLAFDLFFENFNISFIFVRVGTRALIFHRSIHCDKTLPRVPKVLTIWPWPWSFAYSLKTLSLVTSLLKTLSLATSFEWYVLRFFIFLMGVPCYKTFLWEPTSLTLWPWPWCLTYLLERGRPMKGQNRPNEMGKIELKVWQIIFYMGIYMMLYGDGKFFWIFCRFAQDP
jgi:hypothetical protein